MERVLWADAICIDQSRIAERNHPVALMADIYRKCNRCLIGLGKAQEVTDYLDSLSELLTILSKKQHLNHPNAPHINPLLALPRMLLMYVNQVAWWNRIWVVQEVILAPQSLVLYGSFEMVFSDLVNAVEFVSDHDMRAAWNASSQETDQICDCLDHIKVTFIWADLLTLRDHIAVCLKLPIFNPRRMAFNQCLHRSHIETLRTSSMCCSALGIGLALIPGTRFSQSCHSCKTGEAGDP